MPLVIFSRSSCIAICIDVRNLRLMERFRCDACAAGLPCPGCGGRDFGRAVSADIASRVGTPPTTAPSTTAPSTAEDE